MYANIEEFDEDRYEQEDDEAYAHYDNEGTPESKAFITHHLPDLGLKISLNLARSRSKKNPSQNFYTDANIILYTSQTYNNILEEGKYDMKKKLLLDTGCVRTVCGRRWHAHCMATMDPEVRKDVKSKPSRHVFRFGGGEKLARFGTVSIPLFIEGKNFHLKTEVVTSDFPCPISKGAMKTPTMT